MLDNGSSSTSENSGDSNNDQTVSIWSPTGIWWKDFMHFAGPGWFVAIAYVDPGNYQADIQAGATSRYSLLCIIWWTSILSLYVQILCVRLSHHSGMTLAEVQARHAANRYMRYLNWFIAEFSTIITDLPEVIGIGIACNIFFGWPYWVGVVLSLLTTMVFLLALHHGTRLLETIVAVFVAIMAIALFVEMGTVGFDSGEVLAGWTTGFVDLKRDDLFAITGVVGAVVMPHNLYLHTAACQSRRVDKQYTKTAVFYSSIEPIAPVVLSFFINLAVMAIAAERVYGQEDAEGVGLSDFCRFFKNLAGGCSFWAIALLAAGQSSAITTTYTGQYVMDGFLNLRIPVKVRAIMTRLIAITPCVIISILLPDRLNQMVNVVNALLSFLLPFAFTPLVRYNCSENVMGVGNASKGCEKYTLYFFAFIVWMVNAIGLSFKGGGFFGDWRGEVQGIGARVICTFLEIFIQIFYFSWNWHCINGCECSMIQEAALDEQLLSENDDKAPNGGIGYDYDDEDDDSDSGARYDSEHVII